MNPTEKAIALAEYMIANDGAGPDVAGLSACVLVPAADVAAVRLAIGTC